MSEPGARVDTDHWDRLWTPHRMAYIAAPKDADAEPGTAADGPKPERARCPFCAAPSDSDEGGLVVARGDSVYALLNLFPYNPGHLMVVPYRHVPDYTDLDPTELAEFSDFTRHALTVLRAVSAPAGFNIGINAGQVAGAGIAAHLHQHIVPRWAGDANFMMVIGGTKVLPQLLADTRALLTDAW